MRKGYHKHPPVEPDIRRWPVYRLSQDRPQFVRQLRTQAFRTLTGDGTKPVRALLERALFMERGRIRENPWRVDPPDERAFWTKIRKRLGKSAEESNRDTEYELLQDIIHRYAQEIVGTFQVNTFLFARRFLTFFFGRLLNTIADRSLWSRRYKLYDKLNVTGDYLLVRELMKKGTVVVVPTHASNLDSILIGYVLDAILGLPSFSYGAGLNLYNTGYIAYFMNRLGAYRVDRRKKNLIYLETLKTFSRISIERGVNSLFFPGGTRSRSGQIEPRLKVGLLSTAVEAQRTMCMDGRPEKVFIVPLNVSYHFVLEAGSLISQHLRAEGKERYLASSRDDASSFRKNVKFIWKLFSNASEITFSFSRAMDVFGNPVDDQGRSLGKNGSFIDVADYFRLGNTLTADTQRESQYSKILADKIVECYYRDYVVLSSHFVAFLAFEQLSSEHPELDVFGIVKLIAEDIAFDEETLQMNAKILLEALIELADERHIKLSDIFTSSSAEAIIQDGLRNIGVYHAQKPLYRDRKGVIRTESVKTLLFYHNRMLGYHLEERLQRAKLLQLT
jgi:glycerol-3-phosphate O-acyltransferase